MKWRERPGEKNRSKDGGGKIRTTVVDFMQVSTYVCMYVCMYVSCHHIQHTSSMDQPGKVYNPARGQLSREIEYFPVPVRA